MLLLSTTLAGIEEKLPGSGVVRTSGWAIDRDPATTRTIQPAHSVGQAACLRRLGRRRNAGRCDRGSRRRNARQTGNRRST